MGSNEIKNRMDVLDKHFSDLVLRSYEVLIEEKGYTVFKLRALFNSFPSTRRHRHKEFLDKYILKMEQNVTIDDLWSQLCSYWHFINYKLLKFVIDKSRCDSLISDMNTYEKELIDFREVTSLHDFIKCFPEYYDEVLESPSNSHRLKVKVGDKYNTLKHLDRLEKGFVSTFSLPDICGLILKKISLGCFLITWYVPAHYTKLLRWKLSICPEQFFKTHDIESVILNGEVHYAKGSKRTPAKVIWGNVLTTMKLF